MLVCCRTHRVEDICPFLANSCTTALPIVLAHSNLISIGALVMSVTGGLLIYATIISFGMFFQEESEF